MKCEICNEQLSYKRTSDFFRLHVTKKHKLHVQDYYDKFKRTPGDGVCTCSANTTFINYNKGYAKYCSPKCRSEDTEWKSNWFVATGFNKKEVYSDLVECQLCGNSFANQGLGQHIKKSHDITIKEYYDKFKLVTKNKMCHCGNESIFKNLIVGYLTYCSNDCKFSDPNYRKKLSISHKGKRFSDKARRTNEKSGRWIKNTEKDLWLAYQLIVRHETKRHRKKLFSIWNGKCFYTDQVCITDPTEYNNVLYATLDHKISVHQGFKQKINPYYIASLDNLCICTRQYNSQKNVKSTNTSRDT